VVNRNADKTATRHHWQVARRRNGDNTHAYLMKLSHPAGCGKLRHPDGPQPNPSLRLLVVFIPERKVAGQVQSDQSKLRAVALWIDRHNMLMQL